MTNTDNLVLFTVSGPDHPGITAKLMSHIREMKLDIVDMGQAVTHGLLSLSFVVDFGEVSSEHHPLIKELLFEADKQGLKLSYQQVPRHLEAHAETEDFTLSCVAPTQITAPFIEEIAKLLSTNKVNIKRIDNLTPKSFQSVEISTEVLVDSDIDELKKGLLEISGEHAVDMAFLKEDVFRRSKRLIVFDMDSTLIQTEVIDEMADVMGVGPEIRKVTEMAMNGELDFDQALIERVSKLKGLTQAQMQDILDNLPLTPGVEEFINTVRSLGYKVGVISGGFTFFARGLKEKLGLDFAFANELEIKNGELTGKVKGAIVNANQKALLLQVIAEQNNLKMEQTVAIGDGANDLPMLQTAGLGIAFHAKEVVKRQANHQMSHGPMTSILYFLGLPRPEGI